MNGGDALTKSGFGSLTISNANTYTGGTTLVATLTISGTGSIAAPLDDVGCSNNNNRSEAR